MNELSSDDDSTFDSRENVKNAEFEFEFTVTKDLNTFIENTKNSVFYGLYTSKWDNDIGFKMASTSTLLKL
jgi:hypothetical protein